MKCPFCGREMEAGFITSAQTILWGTQAPEAAAKNFWKKTEGEFTLDSHPFGAVKLAGHRCPTCRKIVASYHEKFRDEKDHGK